MSPNQNIHSKPKFRMILNNNSLEVNQTLIRFSFGIRGSGRVEIYNQIPVDKLI